MVVALVAGLFGCAAATPPWNGGGVAPESAADRRMADAAELWIASSAAGPEVRARAAAHALRGLEALPPDELSRAYALDARLLSLDARLFLGRELGRRKRFELERGAPLPPPEELATLRACLAHVLSSTVSIASCASGLEPAADDAAARDEPAPTPLGNDPGVTVDDLWERARSSPYASSPIRQATADQRVVTAWRLLIADHAARTSTSTATPEREAIASVVRPALAELGRYEPGDATWALFAALALLHPGPGPSRPLRARLERHADQGLIPPWLLD